MAGKIRKWCLFRYVLLLFLCMAYCATARGDLRRAPVCFVALQRFIISIVDLHVADFRACVAADVMDPDKPETGIYGSADSASFEVRGENYLVDKVKFPSRPVRARASTPNHQRSSLWLKVASCWLDARVFKVRPVFCRTTRLLPPTGVDTCDLKLTGNVQARCCRRVCERKANAAHGEAEPQAEGSHQHARHAVHVYRDLAHPRAAALHCLHRLCPRNSGGPGPQGKDRPIAHLF